MDASRLQGVRSIITAGHARCATGSRIGHLSPRQPDEDPVLQPEIAIVLVILLVFVLLEIAFTRFFSKPGQRADDAIVEIVSTLSLVLVSQPFALAGGAFLASLAAPDAAGALAGLPIAAQVGLLLVFDDMTQYWWHRLTHNVPWLYNLHRAHHDAEYLSIRVVYRNNVFYYLLMPGIWFSGALIYLGLGWVYAFYLVVKMTVIYGAHSDVRWDRRLYRIGWLSPVMWVVERVISTPATHSAHHGKFSDDTATFYKGNYGNLLFFWDVLFGTARVTRRYPERMGVENLAPMSAAEQLFWPLVRTRSRPASVDEHGVAE
jgi:sterol desaturase/sphingolipid hydroxylase (fatty acid hydroxylase superfamily)